MESSNTNLSIVNDIFKRQFNSKGNQKVGVMLVWNQQDLVEKSVIDSQQTEERLPGNSINLETTSTSGLSVLMLFHPWTLGSYAVAIFVDLNGQYHQFGL